MAIKKVIKDIPSSELQEVVESLKKKGAKIVEVREQDDGLFTVVYELPEDDSDDHGGNGDVDFDFFEDACEAPMPKEGGSRDFP